MGTESEPTASNQGRDRKDHPMTDQATDAEAAVSAWLGRLPGEHMPAAVRARLAAVIAEQAHARVAGLAFHTRNAPTFGDGLVDQAPLEEAEPLLVASGDEPDEPLSPDSPAEDSEPD